MTNQRSYSPGDMVKNLLNQWGIVLSKEQYTKIRPLVREGRKPGRYFAPGCCSNPDYIIQIPVFFEDNTHDVMKAMNLKTSVEIPPQIKSRLEELIDEHTQKKGDML